MDQQTSRNMIRPETSRRKVGETGFTAADIVRNLGSNETVKTVLTRKWTELARSLKVQDNEKMRLENDFLTVRTKNILDVVEWMIIDWESRNASQATLEDLVTIFKVELKMVDAACILDSMQPPDSVIQKTEEHVLTETNLFKTRRINRNGVESSIDGSTEPLVTRKNFKNEESEATTAISNHSYNFLKHILVYKYVKIVIVLGIAVVVAVPLACIYNILFNLAFNNENDSSSSIDINSPNVLPESEIDLPTQNLEEDTNSDISQNCETESSTSIHVSGFREYETKIMEAGSSCVNLTISISNPSDWNENSNMSKAGQITSLVLIGTVGQKLLIRILIQASQIQELHIFNDKNVFCNHIQKGWDTPNVAQKSMHTSKIKSVTLSDFSVCTRFYRDFGIYLQLESLVTISFNNCVFTSRNMIYIQNIIYESRETLENLEITGKTNATQLLYNPDKVLAELKVLKLNVNTMIGAEETHTSLLEIGFCSSFPRLEVFESTAGVTYSDILVLLKCKTLRAITSTVIFGDTDGYWNMMESVNSQHLRLLTLHFTFTGACPNQLQIKQLGLNQDIRGVTKTVSTGKCSISTETQNSKEINIVEEHSKT